MDIDVPLFTAGALAVGGFLLAVSCLASQLSNRFGVPLALVFLIIGMLAGTDGPGKIPFESYDLAYMFGTLALVAILFSGGLHTPLSVVRAVWAPASVLATLGVAMVAGLVACAARLLGMDWPTALLVGAIVSSTDAAAVFAQLGGLKLRGRTGPTIELESGLNDPMAVILTTAMTLNLLAGGSPDLTLIWQVVKQLVIGALTGIAIGKLSRWLLQRVPLATPGLTPVLTLALALIAYGVPTWLDGSGLLSVYLAGIVMGHGHLPHRLTLTRVHDALAWLAQVSMFLMLGLLVFPSELPDVAGVGLCLALFLALVARPVAVSICLLPFRYRLAEVACVSWVGLRGAVPIIIATVPVMLMVDLPEAKQDALRTFDLVFFVVVVGIVIPGATVRWVTRKLGLLESGVPTPEADVSITTNDPIDGSQRTYFVGPDSPAAGKSLAELAFPDDATVMLIVRGGKLIAPRGGTRLEGGDHAFVFCQAESEPAVASKFGEQGDH